MSAPANDRAYLAAWRLPSAARIRLSAQHMRAMALRAAEAGSPQVTQSALRISNAMLAGLGPRVVPPTLLLAPGDLMGTMPRGGVG